MLAYCNETPPKKNFSDSVSIKKKTLNKIVIFNRNFYFYFTWVEKKYGNLY